MPAESALRDRNGPGYELIETLRWERGGGFVRYALHLARMRGSADALGFQWKSEAVENAMKRAVASGNAEMMRLRLTLDREGIANCTATSFTPLAQGTRWRLGIARTTLRSSEPLLRHKTSRRTAYETARAEFPHDAVDEVLLLNEKGELCEGTITTLFLDMGDGGPLLTPALECGLLAGVLRGEMLSQGKACEAVLTLQELSMARAVYVGNSLRVLIDARTI
jgi:4-amino-4-deoxychorismate lyase